MSHYNLIMLIRECCFRFGKFCLPREYLRTLEPEHMISYEVIEGWSVLLNHQEKYKSPGAPYRFFAPVEATVSCFLLYII